MSGARLPASVQDKRMRHPVYRGPYSRGITLVFVLCSFSAFAFMIALPWITPPWYVMLGVLVYVFLSSGLVAIGRIEGNRASRGFIVMIKKQSDENARNLN